MRGAEELIVVGSARTRRYFILVEALCAHLMCGKRLSVEYGTLYNSCQWVNRHKDWYANTSGTVHATEPSIAGFAMEIDGKSQRALNDFANGNWEWSASPSSETNTAR